MKERKELEKEVINAYLDYHDSAIRCMRGQLSIYFSKRKHQVFTGLLEQLHSHPEFNPEPSAEAKKHRH